MKSCPVCGHTAVPDEARFCSMCGQPMAVVVAAEVPAPGGLEAMPDAGKKKRFSETLWFQDGEDFDASLNDSDVELPRTDLQERYEDPNKVDKARREHFTLNTDKK